MNVVDGQGWPDMVMLKEINEHEFMKNLKLRFSQKQIYTYIGEQIISMNPFKRLDNTNDKVVEGYKKKYLYEVQPHIFALAEDTFRELCQSKKDQCVIITGESGAGKTEASKIFMTYITKVSGKSSHADTIKDRLLQSNPVLEAFGNAKTIRNDNSSRFGKYMEIQFDGAAAPLGGCISQYLLEKSRVVTRAENERSFHIFYLVLSQANLLGSMRLSTKPEDYHYLNLSKCYKVPHFDDSAEFKEVDTAMNVLGFDDGHKKSVWNFVGAILNLGNVEFEEEKANASVDSCVVSNKDQVKTVAKLLHVTPEVLEKALITRSISTAGNNIDVFLTVKQAQFARNSLAKSLYSRIFDWVVQVVNRSIETKVAPEMSTGVLDIYGFEIFEKNSFEQFCINFCNEKLQQLFIELVLKSEQEVYIAEGIEWTPVDYFNNQPILDLIESKKGIYQTLDDICMVGDPKPNDLLDRLDQHYSKHAHYFSFMGTKSKDVSRGAFRIKHYAGDVDYEVEEFLFKNQDTLYSSLQAALQTSSEPLMGVLFPPVKASRKRPVTAGTAFKKSVGELVTTLKLCSPHYIRCIKSNDKKQAFGLDEERVKHQCLYLNLVETVRVRKAGFAARRHYNLFLQRYKMVSEKTWPIWRGRHRDGVEEIFKAMGIAPKEYHLGKTQVFVKDALTLYAIELKRQELLPIVAVKIQAAYRGHQGRKRARIRRELQSQKKWVQTIERCYASYRLRSYWVNVREAYDKVANNYGKDMKFPECPFEAFKKGGPYLKRMQMSYWAYKMVTSLSGPERVAMREKIVAYTNFCGQKPWNCARVFKGDYFNTPKNPNLDLYKQNIQDKCAAGGDQEILFSDTVVKINRKGQAQVRAFILTDRNMYKYDPKKYSQKKEAIPLAAVKSINMSHKADSYVIIKMQAPERDLCLDLRVNGIEMASEFSTKLHTRLNELGRQHEIVFEDTVIFNNSRKKNSPGKDYLLTFGESTMKPESMRRFSVLCTSTTGKATSSAFVKKKDGSYCVMEVEKKSR